MILANLPPTATRLLNALHHGLDPEPEYQDFQEERGSVLSWLKQQRSFSQDDTEAADFANLAFLWERIDEAIENGADELDELAKRLIEAFELRDRLRAERMACDFAADEGVNAALMAGTACVDGRATAEVFALWLPELERYLHATWERCLEAGLPSSEKGLLAFEEGIKEWKALAEQDKPDPEACKHAFSWLGWGADSVEKYLSDHPNPSREPFEVLQPGLRRLAQSEAEPEQITAAVEELAESWRLAVDRMLIPLPARQGFEEDMDTALEHLHEALQDSDVEQADSELAAIADIWNRARQLHAQRPALPSFEESLIQAVSGVLAETVPDLILGAFLEYCTGGAGRPLSGHEAIQHYLAEGDPASLHLAVDELLQTQPHPGDAPKIDLDSTVA